MSKEIFSLKQVALSIKKTIENRYERTYWVKGELYKINLFPSGHAFPELVQRENGKIVANMTGIIWKKHYNRIRTQFETTVKEPFTEGKEVLMEVKINFSEVHGLSLHIQDIDPSYSLGALHKLKLETIQKLDSEGLLQKNQLLKIDLPKRIALISAESSKGLSDFLNVIEGVHNKFGIETLLFNASVQGDQAVESIINCLNTIERVKDYFDVVAIVRGGGAEVGMSCYDEYNLCKKIAEFPLPVVCGIGHSTNLTVTEMVSHSHSITPSVLASDLIAFFEEKFIALQENKSKFVSRTQQHLQLSKMQFLTAVSSINGLTKWRLERLNTHLLSNLNNFKFLAQNQLNKSKTSLYTAPLNLKQSLHKIHHEAILNLRMNHKNLRFFSQLKLDKENQAMDFYNKQHSVLSPNSILARGFSITRKDGKAVLNQDILKAGDLIEIELMDGKKLANIT